MTTLENQGSDTPCPDEFNPPTDAPSAVSDAEILIRTIEANDRLGFDEDTKKPKIPAAYWSKEDLRIRKVSVLRDMTSRAEIVRRCSDLTKDGEWKAKPLVAYAIAGALRKIHDARNGRREVCVHADPITDRLGFCATHAGILRSKPQQDAPDRMGWQLLRMALSDAFSNISHLSGQIPQQT